MTENVLAPKRYQQLCSGRAEACAWFAGRGLNRGVLARTLGCSVRTVNARLGEVYRNLQVRNLVEAYNEGIRLVEVPGRRA